MPITFVGQLCARRGCNRPHWKDGLCNRCWRFAQLFKKDPRMLAYQPLDGYSGGTDAVELPWEEWEKEARERGVDVVDFLLDEPRAEEP
ncbi:MAG: hypothetical protein QOI80_2038 [Solirubrobacteraceae bacterium]|nr:hypothetical protein [Solirubrobacteraceae bacterium]